MYGNGSGNWEMEGSWSWLRLHVSVPMSASSGLHSHLTWPTLLFGRLHTWWLKFNFQDSLSCGIDRNEMDLLFAITMASLLPKVCHSLKYVRRNAFLHNGTCLNTRSSQSLQPTNDNYNSSKPRAAATNKSKERMWSNPLLCPGTSNFDEALANLQSEYVLLCSPQTIGQR